MDNYIIQGSDNVNDNKLKSLEYVQSFQYKIIFENIEYEIFAYVFVDSESARQYISNVTGIKKAKDYDYNLSTNYYLSTQSIVYNENCVIRIKGGSYKKFVDFLNFLNESLSKTNLTLIE